MFEHNICLTGQLHTSNTRKEKKKFFKAFIEVLTGIFFYTIHGCSLARFTSLFPFGNCKSALYWWEEKHSLVTWLENQQYAQTITPMSLQREQKWTLVTMTKVVKDCKFSIFMIRMHLYKPPRNCFFFFFSWSATIRPLVRPAPCLEFEETFEGQSSNYSLSFERI